MVTDWNREPQIRWGSGIFANSKKKKYSAGRKIRIPVTVSTVFVCMVQKRKRNRFFRRSSQTEKPRPPTTIRSMIVTLTTGLATYQHSEEYGSRCPIRSKPPLQKADTE